MKDLIKTCLGGFLLLLVRALSPFITIRIGVLNSTRIGHLAANTEYWLRKESRDPGPPGEWRVFVSLPRPANRQLQNMIKRRLRVVESALLEAVLNHARKCWPKLPVWLDLSSVGPSDYELWSNTRPQLSFTPEESRRGVELLRTIGIPDGARFVCLAIRDKAYLNRHMPNRSWAYHDYRDADIERCRAAAEWLASQGIWVLRMGAAVGNPFEAADPRVVDYASRFRSDFGDLYLLGHCKFFLGDTAGIFWPASILGVPTALTNVAPLTHLQPVPPAMLMPKVYRRKGAAAPLSYKEVVASGADRYSQSEQFEAAGIELLENTPEDILGMVREMNARVDGAWASTPEDERLQDRFWAAFPPGHPARGCPARVPVDFLRRQQELLA